VILRVLVFSWWIGPGLYREDAKTRRREDAKKSPSFWLRLCWGRGILGGFFCWPRITRIKFSKASERAAAASQSGAPLLTLKMRPGVVALKEILPQGLLPLVVDLRIVSYGVVPLHLSDDLAFHSQD